MILEGVYPGGQVIQATGYPVAGTTLMVDCIPLAAARVLPVQTAARSGEERRAGE